MRLLTDLDFLEETFDELRLISSGLDKVPAEITLDRFDDGGKLMSQRKS